MEVQKFYFGYGSNLNFDDLRAWSNGAFPLSDFSFVSKAWLADYRLAFTYHSKTRNGGVLDIVRETGSTVPGAIFKIAGSAAEMLRRKEGYPHVYDEIAVVVRTEAGTTIEAFAYQVKLPSSSFVQPADEYVRVVRAGYRAFQVDEAMLNHALQPTSDT